MDHSEEEELVLVRDTALVGTSGKGYQSFVDVVTMLKEGELTNVQVTELVLALPSDAISNEYDEKFNLRDEISHQIKAVRGMRKQIFYANGTLREDYDVNDASRILNASRDLLKLLQNSHDELINYERIQAIETAFLDTIAEMPLEEKEMYCTSLASYLEQHSPG